MVAVAPAEQQAIEYTRPWLADYQLEHIYGYRYNKRKKEWEPPPEGAPRYCVIEASTKSGKTVGCMAWLLEQALVHRAGRGRNFWWVATTYRTADIAYRRFKLALPRGLYRKNDTDKTLTFPNGVMMWFLSAEKPDNLYGEDVYAAVIDEASRCKPETWHAIRSTLTATQGPVRLIMNVRGHRNWAYKLARKAETNPAWHYARITAWDAVKAGILVKAEIEDAKDTLPPDVFKELYLALPSDEASNPFGLDAIANITAPLYRSKPVVWGWDLARKRDWTVGTGLDKYGRACRFERWQQVPWPEQKRRIIDLVGDTQAVIDATGVGDPIVQDVQRKCESVEGFIFTQKSKQNLMVGLQQAIHDEDITIPEGVTVAEMLTFEYEYTRWGVRYTAPEGFSDDCVYALALANWGRRYGEGPQDDLDVW